MVAYTTSVRTEKQANNTNNGTWGEQLNENWDMFDAAIAGVVSKTLTSGGTVTLTDTDGEVSESTYGVIVLSGSIASDANLVIPNRKRNYWVVCNTSGAGTAKIKTSSGTAFSLQHSKTQLVRCDGSNVITGMTNPVSSTTGLIDSGSFDPTATATLENKTIDSADNTLTVDLSEATVTGTKAEFNTALSDDNFAFVGTSNTFTGATQTINSAGSATLALDKNAATDQCSIETFKDGSRRWTLHIGGNEDETGSDAGSNVRLFAYDDAGNYRALVMSIARANGDVTFESETLTAGGNAIWHAGNDGTGSTLDADLLDGVEGATYARKDQSNTFTGATQKIDSSGSATLELDKGASGDVAGIYSRTAGSARWLFQVSNSTAESGGNAGSNFSVIAYDDAGSFLSTPLAITRSNGNVAFGSTTVTAGGNAVWHQANVGTQINALTADSTPDASSDYVATYDASAGAGKKVLLSKLRLTQGTESTATGGASVEFTSIPSGTRQITISGLDVSSNSATTAFGLIQIGDSGGFETTGYDSRNDATSSTTGIVLGSVTTTATTSWSVTLTCVNSTGTKWVASGAAEVSGAASAVWGTKTLSAELDRIRFTVTAGTIDVNGGINIAYQ